MLQKNDYFCVPSSPYLLELFQTLEQKQREKGRGKRKAYLMKMKKKILFFFHPLAPLPVLISSKNY